MKIRLLCRVILLTLGSAFLLPACSLINEHYAEVCNSHAYTRTIIADHVSSRFQTGAPVRLAIIPFSVPANVSAYDANRPGMGNELAWKVQAQMLSTGQIPIVEVFNRQDWPGKSEEFFTGNFGAISLAREAGYDLVMVGAVEPVRSLDKLTVLTKVIETESGLTLWYGRTTTSSYEPELSGIRSWLTLEKENPSRIYSNPLMDKIAICVTRAALQEEAVPE